MALAIVGQPIPVIAQLGNGETNKFVVANLFDPNENLIATLNMVHVARGLYRNSSFLMPELPFVVVQSQAFNDAGHTDPYDGYIDQVTYGSTTDSGNGGGISTNDVIPAVAQFGDGSTNKFPLAYIYDVDGNQIDGSPLALSPVQGGLYMNSTLKMLDIANLVVQVQSFTDADHTVPDDDEYISSAVFTNLQVSMDPLPHCPELTISVASFKAFFVRDFPFTNNIDTGVTNADIEKAIVQSTCFVNKNLFCTPGSYAQAVLLLAAHFLVTNLRNASQGIASNFTWLESGKAVGNVSQSFTIPDSILKNPAYSYLSTTGYGAEFLFIIYPKLAGQMFVVRGRTNP